MNIDEQMDMHLSTAQWYEKTVSKHISLFLHAKTKKEREKQKQILIQLQGKLIAEHKMIDKFIIDNGGDPKDFGSIEL